MDMIHVSEACLVQTTMYTIMLYGIRIYTHYALHQPEEALFSSRVCLRAPYPFFTTPPYVNVVEPSSATFNHRDEFAAKKLLVWQQTTGQGTAIAVIVTRSLIRMIPTAM